MIAMFKTPLTAVHVSMGRLRKSVEFVLLSNKNLLIIKQVNLLLGALETNVEGVRCAFQPLELYSTACIRVSLLGTF